ncbi:MAG TPA: hypothetical protein VD907_05610 [Verrucomicrobiae bacterium]|nr:hypothetical protein [Verrucomicrobiae bacterium]
MHKFWAAFKKHKIAYSIIAFPLVLIGLFYLYVAIANKPIAQEDAPYYPITRAQFVALGADESKRASQRSEQLANILFTTATPLTAQKIAESTVNTCWVKTIYVGIGIDQISKSAI